MCITKLINSEGQLVSTPEDILHYHKLYSSQQTSTDALNNYFGNVHLENKLSPNDSKTCEGKLTVNDCYDAMINMKVFWFRRTPCGVLYNLLAKH